MAESLLLINDDAFIMDVFDLGATISLSNEEMKVSLLLTISKSALELKDLPNEYI